ncbi:MAG: SHOCT domain-containing protein [Candidatus Celaenobacter polaris]|nr:SHOCT domain-containing protein [Candidatus Celaenobacter polaris]
MNKIEIVRKMIKSKKNKLNIFIEEPFGTEYKMNLCYYKVCFLLEEGTNKIVYKDGDGNSIPITTRTFHLYLNMNKPVANGVIYKLRKEGIIFKLSIYGRDVYYLNPKYAFNGDEIPYFLTRLFERSNSFKSPSELVKLESAETVSKLSVDDELKKLKELFDDGIITHEEFDKQKEKLFK